MPSYYYHYYYYLHMTQLNGACEPVCRSRCNRISRHYISIVPSSVSFKIHTNSQSKAQAVMDNKLFPMYKYINLPIHYYLLHLYLYISIFYLRSLTKALWQQPQTQLCKKMYKKTKQKYIIKIVMCIKEAGKWIMTESSKTGRLRQLAWDIYMNN